MAPKKETIEMHLTLRGPRAEVSALLLLAAEQGLLVAMDVSESITPNGATTITRPAHVKHVNIFNPGTRVVVKHDRAKDYPTAVVGRRGVVVTSRRAGKGFGVEVKWDDDPATVSRVASSILARA